MDKHIKFKNDNRNGWILVRPGILASESAKNIHLVEVKLLDNSDEVQLCSTHTYCNEELIEKKKYISECIFHNTPKGRHALRIKVAELQNSGLEVCGKCAGHLYADPVA